MYSLYLLNDAKECSVKHKNNQKIISHKLKLGCFEQLVMQMKLLVQSSVPLLPPLNGGGGSFPYASAALDQRSP